MEGATVTLLHFDLAEQVQTAYTDALLLELLVLGSLVDSQTGRALAWAPQSTTLCVELASSVDGTQTVLLPVVSTLTRMVLFRCLLPFVCSTRMPCNTISTAIGARNPMMCSPTHPISTAAHSGDPSLVPAPEHAGR